MELSDLDTGTVRPAQKRKEWRLPSEITLFRFVNLKYVPPKVASSVLDPEVNYLDWVFSWFCSVHLGNFCDTILNQATTDSFPVPSQVIHTHFSHSTVYKCEAKKGIVKQLELIYYFYYLAYSKRRSATI